jgi:predicted esterase
MVARHDLRYDARMSRAAHAHAVRFYGAVALGVLAVSVGVILQGRSREIRPAAAADRGDGAVVSWCAAGLEAIAGGGCFAHARPSSKPPALLVYLHGRYSPETEADEMERQSRVARLASARGYAVLALRGMQGQCTDPQLATWWCWPSNERNASDGPAFVGRWSFALAEAERRARPARRVLLGFSNGGYFASLIASRALAPFDAVTVAHAGPVAPMTPVGPKPPVLLVDADDDPSSPEILSLDAALTREAWPHAMVIREGGHALPEWDIDMALTFFDRVRTERLPLVPPLAPPRAPHPHVDAGPDPEAPPASASASASAPASASASASASAPAPASADPPAPSPPEPVLDPAP